MANVTITVETERYSSTTIRAEDPADALAQCIYRIAETSDSDRIVAIADAVHRVMRVDHP